MCGIIYGIDTTQHLYVLAMHFKDILKTFCIKNNMFAIIPKCIYFTHIRGPDHI